MLCIPICCPSSYFVNLFVGDRLLNPQYYRSPMACLLDTNAVGLEEETEEEVCPGSRVLRDAEQGNYRERGGVCVQPWRSV